MKEWSSAKIPVCWMASSLGLTQVSKVVAFACMYGSECFENLHSNCKVLKSLGFSATNNRVMEAFMKRGTASMMRLAYTKSMRDWDLDLDLFMGSHVLRSRTCPPLRASQL